tara:strand:- start:663 stop:1547 length:885 start_codon:yes stop_codon:yes gene_type:complete
MRGRTQAIVATVLIAAITLVFTPAAIVSASLIVLATLRNGPQEGFFIVAGSIFILFVFGFVLGNPLTLFIYGAIIWLPSWFFGLILGYRKSISDTLEIIAIFALIVVAAQYLFFGDPTKFWSEILKNYLELQVNASVLSLDQSEEIVKGFSGWMAGGLAASWFISSSLSLFIGFWAHSLLEKNPLFGQDFRKIKASILWLVLLPLFFFVSFFIYDGKPSIMGQLYLVALSLFLIQGISLFHALVFSLGKKISWLVGLYFLLLFGAPSSMTAIAVAGYADGWFNFREKFKNTKKM